MATILIIEDEQPLAKAIATKLEQEGLESVTARTAEQAHNLLQDDVKIDAIWLDHYLLGKENGLDFLAKVKESDSPWRTIPVFLVSNTAGQDKVQSYIRLGVEKYFTKADYRLQQIIDEIKLAIVQPKV